ncbi:hypothetical protein FKM82_002739 [Ascaphus truei]
MFSLCVTLLLLCCASLFPDYATALITIPVPASNSGPLANKSCAAGTDFPSLTFAVDTTSNSDDNVRKLKAVSGVLQNRLSALSPGDKRQYTLAEFNDPFVGPVYITRSATEFGKYLNNLYSYGGGDCPEPAMAGLLLALENSPPNSLIVVTTDGPAKDYNDNSTVTRIFSLLNAKQSKVIFVLSGYCFNTGGPDFQIYKDIASQSFGHIFQINYNSIPIEMLYYLDYMLRTPVNSSIRLFSKELSYSDSSNFSVTANFSALMVTTGGSVNSVRLIGPTGFEEKTRNILSQVWGSLLLLENPKIGIWRIDIRASGPNSVRIEGFRATNASSTNISCTDQCSKCHINATCEEYLKIYTCTCKYGFIGDGFDCSDYDECSNYLSYTCTYGSCKNTYGSYTCVCYNGYVMSSDKTCVDIDECSRPELNKCHAQATCTNYYGSYSCSCPPNYFGNGFDCEFDECTTAVCGFGKDCTKYKGSYSCTDPCFNYTTLNDPRRSSSIIDVNQWICDNSMFGWYRFTGRGGIRMPEVCIPISSCGTNAPMWLSGSHPRPIDGIVIRTVCTNWYGQCCTWPKDLKIRACPGGYHVYKLNGAATCNVGYCTDPATVIDSCACADDEECRLVDGIRGCYCKNISKVSAMETLRPVLTCGAREIKASFKKCQLQSMSLNTDTIHLTDLGCLGFQEFNSTGIISVVSPFKTGVCGNEFIKNKTHVLYRNTIYLSLQSNVTIEGELDGAVSIKYSCAYPLNMQISLDTTVVPFSSSVNITIEGTGLFVARMALYRDESYFIPYEGSVAQMTAKTTLYIGVILDGGDTSKYILVMSNCYATPSSNASDIRKYYIIKDSCPGKQNSTINLAENGVSRNGRFSVQLFEYVKQYNVAYLHCELQICDTTTETCKPFCTGRASRIADTGNRNMALSLGPIVRQDDNIPVPSSDGTRASMALLTPAVLFLARHFFFIMGN